MVLRRRFGVSASAAIAVAVLLAGCGSSGGSNSSGSAAAAPLAQASSWPVKVGVDLTYNNTAFWAAYINYETQYAKQLHIKLLGPLLSAASASLQNQQIQELVNEGAQAIIVNPETATSLGPAISYAASHHVKLISVDTIVGVGKVYMVVRASNLLYGLDACAYISSKVKSGYVLDLEGDLTSSNGADRTNAFNACMAANDPGVKILKDPTVWTDATAVPAAERGERLRQQAEGHLLAVEQPGHRYRAAAQEQGADRQGPDSQRRRGARSRCATSPRGSRTRPGLSRPTCMPTGHSSTRMDAAHGVALNPGEPGGGAPTLQNR